MKLLSLLLAFVVGISPRSENRLDSLVFDFSSSIKSSLPEDGWVKMDFSVVHYNEQKLNVAFNATCLESGMELAFYPQTDRFQLKPGIEQPITLFMNRQCGMLENLEPGQHSRIIRFRFIDSERHDTLSFDQRYVIEIPRGSN